MSAARCWWWLPALLWGGAGGYVVLSSVSWPLPEAGGAADELHSSSTEEALPGLLEEAGGIWKQSFPASAYREDAALGPGASARRSEQGAAPSRMFSYRRQPAAPPGRAATARRLARHGAWGFVASRAAHGKIQGMPYGNLLPVSDGPVNNSTGIPFFYVTLKDNAVADLLKDPVASLTLPESDGNFCSLLQHSSTPQESFSSFCQASSMPSCPERPCEQQGASLVLGFVRFSTFKGTKCSFLRGGTVTWLP
ncbi:protein CREG2 isoform X3 [Lagopus muta]|uniref:protein CREG2 isoform X3 n=1 Tax=Lagopus muta TaxID=64668 RepID=UPI00209F59D0|nr:protein CREG2 isoform X3 [Lagopus muta]